MTARGIAVALVALAGLAPASAGAAFDSCVYDAGARTVTASLTSSPDGRLYVGTGGEIMSATTSGSGVQCGAATTANTDRIDVAGAPTLAAETATIDNSGPGGAFRKAGTSDEIAVYADLGETPWTYDPFDVGTQTLALIGTSGPDEIRAGQVYRYGPGAVNMDAQSDAEVDVHLTNLSVLDLDGGAGDDHVTGLGGTGTVEQYDRRLTLRGSGGDDRLVGNRWANVIYPGAGHDDVDGGSPAMECFPGCGDRSADVLSYQDAPNPVTINYPHQHDNDDGFGSSDIAAHMEVIRGSDHGDTLTNTGVPSLVLDGAGGDDLINGGHRDDVLLGGDGDDHLIADPGPSFQKESSDTLRGGAGDDLLDGGQDPDSMDGGPGDDVLNAGLEESANYDYSKVNHLTGGAGSDVLNGSHGDDTYEFRPPVGDEIDTIHELPGGGRDTIAADWGDYDETATDHALDLSSATTAIGTGGTRTFRVSNAGEAANLENVETGWGADEVTGNRAVNRIATGPGSDLIHARDEVRDTISCGYVDPVEDPDTAVVDALDEVSGCETVERPDPPDEPTDPPDPPDPPPASYESPSLRYGGSRFTLHLPRRCVDASARPRLRVRKTGAGSRSVRVRFVRATFLVDGERVAIDHWSPFRARLPAALAAGRHTVTARLLVKRIRRVDGRSVVGRYKTRTLEGVVEICG